MDENLIAQLLLISGEMAHCFAGIELPPISILIIQQPSTGFAFGGPMSKAFKVKHVL
jgi:hypothetical protein